MTRQPSAVRHDFREIMADGHMRAIQREVAVEAPVALEINGFGYAVLMASPADLEDLATGFALTEGLIDRAADIAAIDRHDAAEGVILRLSIAPHLAERLGERVRPRLSDSSCGLCGLENLQQVMRPLPPVRGASTATDAAIFRARAALAEAQPLNAATGAVHAAALVSADGMIRLVREDVGRHNALDKLIGAMLRDGLDWDGGFTLLSSRCSFELVEKAVIAGCPMLVTISAPTSLAISRAADAGLRLVVLARQDSMLSRG
jgi:FdhD protein